jgi:hypothetical protein
VPGVTPSPAAWPASALVNSNDGSVSARTQRSTASLVVAKSTPERQPNLVSCLLSSFTFGVVQVRACRRKATRGVDTQGRRGRHTGSYANRGERREVRAWAAPTVKTLKTRH